MKLKSKSASRGSIAIACLVTVFELAAARLPFQKPAPVQDEFPMPVAAQVGGKSPSQLGEELKRASQFEGRGSVPPPRPKTVKLITQNSDRKPREARGPRYGRR